MSSRLAWQIILKISPFSRDFKMVQHFVLHYLENKIFVFFFFFGKIS